eukprot:COSAG01_NODE_20062_length_973_cov_1.066362_1_plen_54_part_01
MRSWRAAACRQGRQGRQGTPAAGSDDGQEQPRPEACITGQGVPAPQHQLTAHPP